MSTFIRCYCRLITVCSLSMLFSFAAGVIWAAETPPPPATDAKADEEKPALVEHFTAKTLDATLWTLTKKNDFQESTVEIAGETEDARRLCLRASTIGTDDKTVKYHGVRTVKPVIDLAQPAEIRYELDWNKQVNGCYMTAGIVICPTATSENPLDEKEYIRVDYIGVPPGQNARLLISIKLNGNERYLYTEGWPAKQKTGRKIEKPRVRIVLSTEKIALWEDDKPLYEGAFSSTDKVPSPLKWTNAYLYLQQSSHSNYRAREVFFDNIEVRTAEPDKPAAG